MAWSLICRHCSFQKWYSHLEIVSALQWKTQSSLLGFQLGCYCKILFHKHNRWTIAGQMNYSLKSQNTWTHDQLQTQRTYSLILLLFIVLGGKKKSRAVYRWILENYALPWLFQYSPLHALHKSSPHGNVWKNKDLQHMREIGQRMGHWHRPLVYVLLKTEPWHF